MPAGNIDSVYGFDYICIINLEQINMEQPALYNRRTKTIEHEDTYKVNGLAFLYNTELGKALTKTVLNKPLVSNIYRRVVKGRKSVHLIHKFIEHYKIDLTEVKNPVETFKNFNDFFIRELKDGARPIDTSLSHLISPADARLFIFDLARKESLPVKGYWYNLLDLVKDKNIAEAYRDGWCFIYRLAPNDYHRYCYIDNGTQEKVKRLRGVLHSVNPIALSATKQLMARNYRELTILETENFGEVIHLEVGALLVGRVVNHQKGEYHFKKGEEKGYFEYGGSTIIQLFKKEAITPDNDILAHSVQKIETLVRMGEKVGLKN